MKTLIPKYDAKIAIRDATKRLPTMAIRAMYAIDDIEPVDAIPTETIESVLKDAAENACEFGDSEYAAGMRAAVEYIRGKLQEC